MRRGCALTLLALGAWMLATALVAAFMDLEPGLADNLLIAAVMAGVAVVPLAVGTVVNPEQRRRELGVTILSGVGLALFFALCALAIFLDPAMAPFLPPMPDVALNPGFGAAATLAVAAAGWWLTRRGAGG